MTFTSNLSAIAKFIYFYMNSGYTIMKVVYKYSKPIVKYYKVPTSQLKMDVLNKRSPNDLYLQNIMNKAIELKPSDAKKAITNAKTQFKTNVKTFKPSSIAKQYVSNQISQLNRGGSKKRKLQKTNKKRHGHKCRKNKTRKIL